MGGAKTRRQFLSETTGLAALAALGAAGQGGGGAATRRPNILLILADDLGYGDLSCYGCPDIRTPALDRLAAQGVRFTSFYSNGPECTPTRTALLTGRYQHRVGGLECAIGTGNVGRYDDAERLAKQHDLGLPVSETSIARLLGDAGYATAIFGKWHLGYEPKFLPPHHGFEHFIGPLGGGTDYFKHTEPDGTLVLYQNDQPLRREGYMTDIIADEAIDFIRRQDQRPFFLYVPFTAPHAPYQGPNDQAKQLRADEWDKGSRQTYAAMTEHMDKRIGTILDALEQKGFAHDTAVIFMSDNGGNQMGRNAPFSGHKGGLFEGGIRVPCIARWPGALPAGVVSDHVCITMDFTASMARMAGAVPAKDRPFDGADILREIEAGRPPQKRTLFWRARRGDRTWRAVRDGAMKYIARHQDGAAIEEHLFELERDPAEKNDLLAARPDDVTRLKRLLGEWEAQVRHSR